MNQFETKIENDTVTITKYVGNETEVFIPESIDEKQVVCVGGKSFRLNKDIISVTISDNIQEIGEFAFSKCRNLKRIA